MYDINQRQFVKPIYGAFDRMFRNEPNSLIKSLNAVTEELSQQRRQTTQVGDLSEPMGTIRSPGAAYNQLTDNDVDMLVKFRDMGILDHLIENSNEVFNSLGIDLGVLKPRPTPTEAPAQQSFQDWFDQTRLQFIKEGKTTADLVEAYPMLADYLPGYSAPGTATAPKMPAVANQTPRQGGGSTPKQAPNTVTTSNEDTDGYYIGKVMPTTEEMLALLPNDIKKKGADAQREYWNSDEFLETVADYRAGKVKAPTRNGFWGKTSVLSAVTNPVLVPTIGNLLLGNAIYKMFKK